MAYYSFCWSLAKRNLYLATPAFHLIKLMIQVSRIEAPSLSFAKCCTEKLKVRYDVNERMFVC